MKETKYTIKNIDKIINKMEKDIAEASEKMNFWQERMDEITEVLNVIRPLQAVSDNTNQHIDQSKIKPSEPERLIKKIVTLPQACDGCGSHEYEFLRHQGNRYGNFNMYKCSNCRMRKNVKDSENTAKNASTKTNELREMALRMGVK